MLSIPLEKSLETALQTLAIQMGKPLSECLREAVCEYIEDRHEFMVGVAAIKRNESSVTLDKLEARFALDH